MKIGTRAYVHLEIVIEKHIHLTAYGNEFKYADVIVSLHTEDIIGIETGRKAHAQVALSLTLERLRIHSCRSYENEKHCQ